MCGDGSNNIVCEYFAKEITKVISNYENSDQHVEQRDVNQLRSAEF